ncbi:zinc finger protein 558 [Anopheles sinensis]|uniref:Zinc finger protein 558 n=1 Tax=Anopheles sinensis TaxID=74873 RepID=A0A084W664_ANOSI|nr:zinc finger protein 558 [Anopheles sinensis]
MHCWIHNVIHAGDGSFHQFGLGAPSKPQSWPAIGGSARVFLRRTPAALASPSVDIIIIISCPTAFESNEPEKHLGKHGKPATTRPRSERLTRGKVKSRMKPRALLEH